MKNRGRPKDMGKSLGKQILDLGKRFWVHFHLFQAKLDETTDDGSKTCQLEF